MLQLDIFTFHATPDYEKVYKQKKMRKKDKRYDNELKSARKVNFCFKKCSCHFHDERMSLKVMLLILNK